MLPPFANEPLTDFSIPENNAAYLLALAQVRRHLGAHRPLVIAGEDVDTCVLGIVAPRHLGDARRRDHGRVVDPSNSATFGAWNGGR